MKELIIITLILIIIIFGGIGIQFYLDTSSSKLIKDLDNIKNLANNEENKDKLKEECNKLYDNWKKTEKGWSIIVLHEELDLIEQALIETKVNMQENNIKDGEVAIERSIFLIKHIPEKERLSLKNIF